MFARLFAVTALAVALPLSVSFAFAQSAAPATAAAPAADTRAACKADMDKLCPNVERGEARRACIEANKDKFSPACKAARDAAQDQRDAVRTACSGDIAKLCVGTERGQGRMLDCIRASADKVTPACKVEIDKLPMRAARSSGAEDTSPPKFE